MRKNLFLLLTLLISFAPPLYSLNAVKITASIHALPESPIGWNQVTIKIQNNLTRTVRGSVLLNTLPYSSLFPLPLEYHYSLPLIIPALGSKKTSFLLGPQQAYRSQIIFQSPSGKMLTEKPLTLYLRTNFNQKFFFSLSTREILSNLRSQFIKKHSYLPNFGSPARKKRDIIRSIESMNHGVLILTDKKDEIQISKSDRNIIRHWLEESNQVYANRLFLITSAYQKFEKIFPEGTFFPDTSNYFFTNTTKQISVWNAKDSAGMPEEANTFLLAANRLNKWLNSGFLRHSIANYNMKKLALIFLASHLPTPPFGIISLFLLIYVLLAGPVIPLILSWRKQIKLSWIILPGIAITATGIIVFSALFSNGIRPHDDTFTWVHTGKQKGWKTTYHAIYAGLTEKFTFIKPGHYSLSPSINQYHVRLDIHEKSEATLRMPSWSGAIAARLEKADTVPASLKKDLIGAYLHIGHQWYLANDLKAGTPLSELSIHKRMPMKKIGRKWDLIRALTPYMPLYPLLITWEGKNTLHTYYISLNRLKNFPLDIERF